MKEVTNKSKYCINKLNIIGKEDTWEYRCSNNTF